MTPTPDHVPADLREAGDLDRVHAAVAQARATLRGVRDLARQRRAGAAEVARAEYVLHCALAAADRLGWHPPTQPHHDDDDDDEEIDGEGAPRKSAAAPPRPRG